MNDVFKIFVNILFIPMIQPYRLVYLYSVANHPDQNWSNVPNESAPMAELAVI